MWVLASDHFAMHLTEASQLPIISTAVCRHDAMAPFDTRYPQPTVSLFVSSRVGTLYGLAFFVSEHIYAQGRNDSTLVLFCEKCYDLCPSMTQNGHVSVRLISRVPRVTPFADAHDILEIAFQLVAAHRRSSDEVQSPFC